MFSATSGDVLGHKLGVHIGVADLNDVQLHGLADELLNALAILLDLRAALADDHAGTGHMQVNGDNLAAALDLDLGDTGCIQELLQVHADLVILYQEVAYLLIAGIPTGIPVFDDAHAEAVGINFLSHKTVSLPYSFSATASVT